MVNECCGNCKYVLHDENEDTYTCRRYPAGVMKNRIVPKTNWCGEWKDEGDYIMLDDDGYHNIL